MIRAHWHDGVTTSAGTWEELTEAVAELPWNRTLAAPIRNELVRRAYVWSGEIVDPTLPDELLWRELDRVGMVEIETEGGLAA